MSERAWARAAIPPAHAEALEQVHMLSLHPAIAALLLASCAGSPQPPPTHATVHTADHTAAEADGVGDVDRRSLDHHFASPEAFASEWNDPARDEWQKPSEIVAALALSGGGAVADLGTGTGYLIEPLRAAVGAGGRVLALDVEPAMIAFLEVRGADEGWDNVEARLSAHDDPTLAPESVDAVVTLNTWHHVAERTAFAEKIRAGLTEGGRFVVVDFIPEPTEGHGPPLEMRLAPQVVADELEAAGFSAAVIEETLPRHYIVVGTRQP